jgi:hypothetical protein
LTNATFSNIEHQGLEYVTDCLSSIAVNWEQTLWRELLSVDERKDYFFEFMLDALTRGDLAARYAAYATGRNWGWLSANDVRAIENMNPIEDGDLYLQPQNMIEAGTTFEDQMKLQSQARPPSVGGADNKPQPKDGGIETVLGDTQQRNTITLLGIDNKRLLR